MNHDKIIFNVNYVIFEKLGNVIKNTIIVHVGIREKWDESNFATNSTYFSNHRQTLYNYFGRLCANAKELPAIEYIFNKIHHF